MSGRSEADLRVRQVLWQILFLNLAVAAAKLWYGARSGSASILADGVHSFSDGASNVFALIALAVATLPPDDGHPYGHRKFEVLGSLGIGGMILLGMLGVLRQTLKGDLAPPDIGPAGFAIVVTTLVVNVGVAAYEAREGRRLQSRLLEADSRHTATDVMATLAVLVAITCESFGFAGADRAAALIIVMLIGYASISIFRGAIDALVDAAPLDRDALAAEVQMVPGVVDCHKVRSRGVPGEILVDLHVQVDPGISVAEGHRIAHRVQRHLQRVFPGVVEVFVHTEPAKAEQLEANRLRRAEAARASEL